MLDIRCLALSIMGIYLIIDGEDKGIISKIAAGWIIIAFSVMIKFTALINIFVVAAYYVVNHKKLAG